MEAHQFEYTHTKIREYTDSAYSQKQLDTFIPLTDTQSFLR